MNTKTLRNIIEFDERLEGELIFKDENNHNEPTSRIKILNLLKNYTPNTSKIPKVSQMNGKNFLMDSKIINQKSSTL